MMFLFQRPLAWLVNTAAAFAIIAAANSRASAADARTHHYIYDTDALKIEQLTTHTFVHLSYLQTKEWGNVPSNGVIFENNSQVIVLDSPANKAATDALIDWITSKGWQIKAVVANHFHEDCVGGLPEFHKKHIPSYATSSTIKLMEARDAETATVPQNGFGHMLKLTAGDSAVINVYPGDAHTTGNIASYIPSDRVLFGGCMVKEMGASKGNLADADVSEWSNTVRKVKKQFPKVKYVVPGHGTCGGTELLDYTIDLFDTRPDSAQTSSSR